MSIFYKDCPQCATTHAANAIRCSCGHFFVPESEAGPELSPELRAQEEKLYEAYLAARRDQTAEAVALARAEVSRTPASTQAASLLAEAEAALKAAETELNNQREKHAESRRLADVARANADTPQTRFSGNAVEITSAGGVTAGSTLMMDSGRNDAVAKPHDAARTAVAAVAEPERNTIIPPARTRTKVEARAQLKAQKTARAALAKARAEQLVRAESEIRARQLVQAEEALRAAREEAERAAREEAERAAREEAERAAREEAERAAREELRRAARVNEEIATAQALSEQTQTARRQMAEQAFRAAQTAKAEHALIAAKAEQLAAQPGTGAAFRAAQSARAAQIVAAAQAEETKECPSCTATLALLATKCRCGFTFPAGLTELPALTLSPVELAELFGITRS